ncbi:MAG: AraC family transcriptional regulator [Thermoplasmata archaeon]
MESRKASNIAYIEHLGPYDKVPWDEYMERLYGWAREQKVMPAFYPMAIYYSDPEESAPEERKSEIAITFEGKAKEQAGVKIKKLPAMKVVSISHRGPGSEFKNTYASLDKWMVEKGYVCADIPIEIYTRKPKVAGGVTVLHAKVMMPVKKK